ncbi:hypothetical protein PMAYCL1PPCAC_04028, partial [Pristionchus mayeri]
MIKRITFSYFILLRPLPTTRNAAIFNAILALPAIFFAIIFNFGIERREVLDALLSQHVPQYNLTNKALSGISSPLCSPVLPSIVWIVLSCAPCIFLNISVGVSIK